ncbi:MAG: glycosyltransferase, partial [Clostridia bacterium]|nr:glycosyltransferase [Clostridia bacterium]
LSKRGLDVSVANLNRVSNYVNTHKQTVNDAVRIFELQSNVLSTKNNLKFLIDVTKTVKPDVVIGFTNYPNMYAKVMGMIFRIPSIMSERGDPRKTQGYTFKAKISKLLIKSSRGGVFQTDGAKDFYGKGLQKRGIVIPNPIFINGEVPYVSYDKREKSVVSVGRLDNTQKRYDVMLEAFKIFSKTHQEYVLKIYGIGDDEEKIRSWVEKLELTEKVKFMGLTKQPMQDICSEGMFLITSDFEGISNSLLEAMAVGLPCVSTDHTPGGARLLITDHENGLLAPIGDAEKLAQAMAEFAENPDLARKCGENAKNVTERFAPERIIDLWENYIRKVVGKTK